MPVVDFSVCWEYRAYASGKQHRSEVYVHAETLNSSKPGAYVTLSIADEKGFNAFYTYNLAVLRSELRRFDQYVRFLPRR